MYPGVVPALRQFLGHGEGDLNFMYLDNRQGERKVTTGIGYLIDPLAACLERHTSNRLPWYCGERLATEQEVRREWEQVKSMQNFGRGQSGAMFQGRTNLNLRLRQPNIEAYFAQQAADYRQQLVTGSPKLAQFDTYPADAQMGVLALAWAVGAGGILATYDEFRTACFRRAWQAAANQSGWTSATAGRRAQVSQMFLNADAIERQNNWDREHRLPLSYDVAQVRFPQRVVVFTRPTTITAGGRAPGR